MGPYCKFCQMRCFVPMPKGTPDYILKAYGSSTIVATCRQGQAFEKQKTGYCYDDIKGAIAALEQARAEEREWWLDAAKRAGCLNELLAIRGAGEGADKNRTGRSSRINPYDLSEVAQARRKRNDADDEVD